jgi:DNA gyrase subunit A
MGTTKGTIKKTDVTQFENVRKSGLIAIKLRDDDALQWVKQSDGESNVVMISHGGQCIQFSENDVRPMGRASMGVRGMKLKGEDHVIQMDIVAEDGTDLLIITENGLGKRSPLTSYRFQSRGGSGVKTANLTPKTGKIVKAEVLEPGIEGDLVMVSKEGQIIRLSVSSIPTRGRATQGVYLMRLKNKKDRVASISIIRPEPIIEEEEEPKPEDNKKADTKSAKKTDKSSEPEQTSLV